ncbi:hypothetical protein BDV59DRAFT_187524 [Aspergillus ambiguus]|uniref:uncharacterized protein n=1 Tax=Aspergillus ambiguus TaxID=176160 RepID=UPI003CCDF1A7
MDGMLLGMLDIQYWIASIRPCSIALKIGASSYGIQCPRYNHKRRRTHEKHHHPSTILCVGLLTLLTDDGGRSRHGSPI